MAVHNELYLNQDRFPTFGKDYYKEMLSRLLNKNFALNFLGILSIAFMNVMYESVVFCFMSYKIGVTADPLYLTNTFYMMIPFVTIHLLLSLVQCNPCFKYNHNGYSRHSMYVRGAILNILPLIGMAIIAIVFRSKAWDFDDHDESKTFLIFILGGLYTGLCKVLMEKQLRSFSYKSPDEKMDYDITFIQLDIVTIII